MRSEWLHTHRTRLVLTTTRPLVLLALCVAFGALGAGCTYLTNFARPIVEPPPDTGPEDAGPDAATDDAAPIDASADAVALLDAAGGD